MYSNNSKGDIARSVTSSVLYGVAITLALLGVSIGVWNQSAYKRLTPKEEPASVNASVTRVIETPMAHTPEVVNFDPAISKAVEQLLTPQLLPRDLVLVGTRTRDSWAQMAYRSRASVENGLSIEFFREANSDNYFYPDSAPRTYLLVHGDRGYCIRGGNTVSGWDSTLDVSSLGWASPKGAYVMHASGLNMSCDSLLMIAESVPQ